jgi:uncharacterized membrane protein YbhN (UPF0104 family)
MLKSMRPSSISFIKLPFLYNKQWYFSCVMFIFSSLSLYFIVVAVYSVVQFLVLVGAETVAVILLKFVVRTY